MRLKLNCDKTELISFGSWQQLSKCSTTQMDLDGNLIPMSRYVKYLGGGLDATLNFKKHIGTVTGKAMANFFKIRGIRQFLNKEACQTLLLGLCISHLDYSNAMLYGVPEVDINCMQRVQNMCAKLTPNLDRYNSVTEALKKLRWLPIRQRITFKILTIVHKCMYSILEKLTHKSPWTN